MKAFLIRTSALAAAIVALCACVAWCQFLGITEPGRSGVVERSDNSEIDWGAESYFATGEGVMPSQIEEPNRAKAFLKAKGYAKMKAIANLLMAIEGTTISYKAIGRDYIAKDETLQQTIDGYVKNVEVVGEKQVVEGGDAMVLVTVKAPMYGPSGVGAAILRSKLQREMGSTDSSVRVEARRESVSEAGTKGPYTALLVDCAGLGLDRAMSPKIRKTNGAEIWGTTGADHEFIIERGIVAYARSLSEARQNSRAGSNPMVVRAVGRGGGRFMCDAVVSDQDADRISQENSVSHYLDRFDVVFVVDAK